MKQFVDGLCITLVVAAAACFSWGVLSLTKGDDVQALYLLALGGLMLGAASRMLKPGYGR